MQPKSICINISQLNTKNTFDTSSTVFPLLVLRDFAPSRASRLDFGAFINFSTGAVSRLRYADKQALLIAILELHRQFQRY